jgi:plasmid maintenance system antidote protein VapI
MNRHAVFLQFATAYPTQRELAVALGVTEATVSRLISGKRKVSRALAVKAEELSAGKFTRTEFLWGKQGEAA